MSQDPVRHADSRPLHVIVLAAGQGKRMRSARAKVMIELAGQPMLSHVLVAAQSLSPAKIHVVVGHRAEQVRAHFAGDDGLCFVDQTQQKGTGHAVAIAMPQVPDDARVLVLFADVPLVRPSTLQRLVDADGALAVAAFEPADPTGYGRVLTDADGRVLGIVEERDASPAQRAMGRVNSGLIAADADRLRDWLGRINAENAQQEYYLTDVFALAAAEGSAASMVLGDEPAEFAGANDPAQLAKLEEALRTRRVQALQNDFGVRMTSPGSIWIRGDVEAGSDVELDVHIHLEGSVRLGEGCRIGPFCRIRDCTLAAGTVIRGHCDLEGVQTTGACIVGPFARLRPGTELAQGVHIGNFVETKNAKFDTGAKANHLTYAGDATIGAAANLGAGTITCNYDGANKHHTKIGARAFIGSNCALVAPVEIGDDATIGAGSVITHDAPAGKLSLARARQSTVDGFERPVKKVR